MEELILAHEERIFREVMYPNLLIRFQQISDEGAKKIVQGDAGGDTIRDQAFRVMLERIMPRHLNPGGDRKTRAAKLLPTLTPRAAEGLIQASEHAYLEGPIWIDSRLPVLWPHIVAIAEAFHD